MAWQIRKIQPAMGSAYRISSPNYVHALSGRYASGMRSQSISYIVFLLLYGCALQLRLSISSRKTAAASACSSVKSQLLSGA